MLTSLSRWLTSPVVEDFGIDRPFRLRRVSLMLIAAGWLTFLVSCLLGLWLKNAHTPVFGWVDVLRGVSVSSMTAVQYAKLASEVAGGLMFIAGMFSVSLFDRQDRIPVWKAE